LAQLARLGVHAQMAALSRLLYLAGAVVLCAEAPSLVRATGHRGKRCLKAQLQLVLLAWLLRRATSVASVWGLIEVILPVRPAVRILQSPVGSLAAGFVVPALLALSGLPLALGMGGARQDLWLTRVLVYGSVPTLVDAADECFGDNVDTIALLAFELGLLMGEHGAAAVILLMLSGGEALEHYAFARARHGLEHVLDREPPMAHRLRPRQTSNSVDVEEVNATEVRSGDVLMVRAGEIVPVDGHLSLYHGYEAAVVDEGLLTGETGGTQKSAGDLVMSGSIAHQPFYLSVTTPFAGCTLELMRQALQDALERKGSLQQRSARAALVLKPLTLAIAAFVLVFRRGRPALQRWNVVLSVLMSATPCPASIGVPVALLSGMSVAARHGVLIKSGAAIESLAAASHIVLDKTGTLTIGKPEVQSFEVAGCSTGGTSWREALQLVASVELLSTHPLAAALCRFAESQGIELLPAEDPEHVYGCGVVGSVAGHRVLVGTQAFLECRACAGAITQANKQKIERPNDLAGGALLEVHFNIAPLCNDARISGHALLEDPLQESSIPAVAKLRQLGLEVSILSGDRSAHLKTVAQQVGVHNARGGCLPQEKAKLVRELTACCCVIMVGDEGNDAPALAAAHVGISVGTSGLASQSADVVVGSHPSVGALERVARLVVLSRAVVATAGRGVRFGLSLSALQVACAGTGRISPRTNAIMQELVDFSALVNAASVLHHRW